MIIINVSYKLVMDTYISVLYVKLSNKEERNIIDIVIYHLLQHVRVVPIS